MRTRAYRPEVSCRLEGRWLMSAANHPYVLGANQSKLIVTIVARSFAVYTHTHDRVLLKSDLDDVVAITPFAKVDGLPAKFDGIVDQMVDNIHENVPHAIRSAADQALAASRAEVTARVHSGDVVLK